MDKGAGYVVMATARSTGGRPTSRQFADSTIEHATADPNQYAYFLEIVNCSLTLEPIGVQISVAMS